MFQKLIERRPQESKWTAGPLSPNMGARTGHRVPLLIEGICDNIPRADKQARSKSCRGRRHATERAPFTCSPSTGGGQGQKWLTSPICDFRWVVARRWRVVIVRVIGDLHRRKEPNDGRCNRLIQCLKHHLLLLLLRLLELLFHLL